jgi:mono/diheme cytochrome c family protein
MADRRTFLGAVSGAATTLLLAAGSAAADPATPAPAPTSSPVAKPPSAAAQATAATMRRFDPTLTDAELEAIARGIDENAAGAVLNPHHATALHNSDEPVLHFAVPR